MSTGLTPAEKQVLDALAHAWNLWVDLPRTFDCDDADFQQAIHSAQKVIALRVARRANPEIWRPGAEASHGG